MIRNVLRLVPESHRAMVPGYLAMIVLSALAQAAAYVLLVPMLGAVLSGRVQDAWGWTAAIAGAALLVCVGGYRQSVIGIRIGIGMALSLQTRLGDHIATLPLGWFGSATAGRVSQLVSASVRDVMGVFAHLLAPMLTGVVVPVAVALGMLFVDPRVSLAMLLSAPLLYLVNRWGQGVYSRAEKRVHAAAEESDSRVIEFAQAQPVLRAFGAAGDGNAGLQGALQAQRRVGRGLVWASVPGLVVFSLLVQLTFVLLVFLAVALAAGSELSVPSAIALIAVSSRFVEPLNQSAELTTAMRGAANAADRITGLLATEPLPEPEEDPRPVDASVRFTDVRFAYDGGAPVIDGVSFEVPAGTTTALVGPSGSGKTTLLRLASRFYDVDAGEVAVGGHPIAGYRSGTLMAQFSLVFQDVYLFHQTIEENVRIGRVDATADDIARVAGIARVDEIVERLPDGWSTDVGEGGTSLSGGERQRVSIARALLKDAPIVLLDEATSALDPRNEAAVVRGLRELTRDKTVIVVAHRLSTIRHADQIVFLDAGRIVERGTHDELLAADGRYARFWNERSRASGWRLAAAAEPVGASTVVEEAR
ncbi:ABC transporter ATP-binding protein [Microbacterium marinilacus]|uniref:ABC transporter ATP-binding protein n=1 Tax=Microbacterium marinilacus TaxID=415209 RepID=A0ABP7B3D6_9MICO|nr:ABC transporter ATP-binding protein [Microbacterium marinilacus]MBY0687891.1 ABC transporter ATP-binding protein/permease [Microbacterium marinilacus]